MNAGCAELSLTQTKSQAREAAEELVEGFRLAGRFMRDAKSTFTETQGIFPTLMSHLDKLETDRVAMLSALKAMDAALTEAWGSPGDVKGFEYDGTVAAWTQLRSVLARVEAM